MLSKKFIGLVLPRFVTHGLAAVSAGFAVAASTAYAANKSSKAAKKGFKNADAAAEMQYDISQQQLDLADEQWNTYKERILPLEMEAQELGIDAQQLAQQRGEKDFQMYMDFYAPMQESFVTDAMEGVEADPKRAAAEARREMNSAFDSSEGMAQRNLERRGVRPGSGNYDAVQNDNTLARSASTGFAVNRAIEAERDRVEDVNFNRKAVALGRQPLANAATQSPGSPGVTAGLATAGYGAAGRTAGAAGNAFQGLGNTYANAAGGIMNAGIQGAMGAYDLYQKYSNPSSAQTFGFNSGGGYDYAMSGGYGTVPNSPQSTMLAEQNAGFAQGGPVNAPMSGPPLQRPDINPGGTVSGPPGYDQVPATINSPDGNQYPAALSDDEYVIPADVVRKVGTGQLDEIIRNAREEDSTLKRGGK